MGATLLLLLQAATASPPERIDLLQPVTTAGCRGPAGEDIVVCGGRTDRYRLPRLEPRPEPAPIPKAQTTLFGGAGMGAIEAEAVQMPGGLQSNRLMARIKLPF